jgi:hypothetical protein
MVTGLTAAMLALAWAPKALATNDIVPLAPFVNVAPSCADPTETISYVPQDGVVWAPADQFTLQPNGDSMTAVATPADGSTFDPTAQTQFPFTNTFDPALCPTANDDTSTIRIGHSYNVTDQILRNDTFAAGCTPQITEATQTNHALNGTVTYHKASSQVTVLSWRIRHYPVSYNFTYTVKCVESGFTSTATDTVTVRPTWKMRVKLLRGHRYKVINHNSTFIWVQDWKSGGHQLIKPFKVKAHSSSKPRKRPRVDNMLVAKLGKYKATLSDHFLRRW